MLILLAIAALVWIIGLLALAVWAAIAGQLFLAFGLVCATLAAPILLGSLDD